jgi:hypothetical protein
MDLCTSVLVTQQFGKDVFSATMSCLRRFFFPIIYQRKVGDNFFAVILINTVKHIIKDHYRTSMVPFMDKICE